MSVKNKLSKQSSSSSVSSSSANSIVIEKEEKINNEKNCENLSKPVKNWLILVTIRLVLNLFSQRSYIHPDEFFQGVEIISGDLFNCSNSIYRAWEFEFNKNQEPIRNMAIPYLFYGFPLYILKYLSSIGSILDYTKNRNNLNDMNLISVQANTLLYYPRLFMTIYSLIIDFCLLKISNLCDLDQSTVLITFASSYITNVYLTRTFSNSIETILFSILIYLIIKSIKSQYVLNDKFLIESSDKNKSVKNVISSSKNEFKITNSILKNQNECVLSNSKFIKRLTFFDIFKFNYLGDLIGLVLCIGIFNRPTFLIYSFVPIFYWLFHGLENSNNFKQFISFILKRALTLCKLFVPASFLFILFDTAYFYKIDCLNELIHYIKNYKFVLTPFNFFKYNSNPNNLKQHGEHPIYQHILNCFLLFGINHVILIIILTQFFTQTFSSLYHTQIDEATKFKRIKKRLLLFYSEIVNNLFCFFIFSFLLPLIIFSLVSHKEPRFLLPLLIPICLLTSHCIFGNQSSLFLRTIWICFNFINLLVFGYFHQGGVIPSLNHVQKIFTHISNLDMDQHVIYYHTYMPPRHLVMAPVKVNLINNKRYIYEFNRKNIEPEIDDDYDEMVMPQKKLRNVELPEPVRKVYDLMSSSNVTQLESLILDIKRSYFKNNNSNVFRKNFAIFLVAPSIIDYELTRNEECYLTSNDKQSGLKKSTENEIKYDLDTSFKFHITFEHLEEHLNFLKCKFSQIDSFNKNNLICHLNKCKQMSLFERVFKSFSLNLYQIIF